jgi:hypothetical protein
MRRAAAVTAMGGGSGDDQATRAQDVQRAEGAAGGGLRGPRMNGYTRMNAYGCHSWSSKAAGEDNEGGGREVGRIDFLCFGGQLKSGGWHLGTMIGVFLKMYYSP